METKVTLNDTVALMRDLRKRCDWDAAQTHESLRPYLIEECHELDEAIRNADPSLMREELGDVLLQVLFHSVIAEEREEFDANDVAHGLIAKMKARHPHLYGEGAKEPWERMKSKKRRSIADGLPLALPPLHRAHRLQDRAAGVGFDWPDTAGPIAKIEEELAEVQEHLGGKERADPHAPPVLDAAHAELEAELGDLLFACVNLCRKAGVHAALALDKANSKFEERFRGVEGLAAERGIDVRSAGLSLLDSLWDEVKTTRR
ncbi:MAG TPA: nucleoside triphosphate pyrophosphohydrolase [Gemmatimonadaceae bacterium]|nr:nucleoside triphosphate pyrophosphohydrolase [Gemmatimonadaceae bacterium]